MNIGRRWMLVGLLSAALILSGCNPAEVAEKAVEKIAEKAQEVAEEAAEATPTPEEEATATPEPEEVTEETDDDITIRDLEDVEGLTSYRTQTTTEINNDGTISTASILMEYSAEGPATRMLSTGDGESWEVIRIGDATYMKGSASEDWVAMTSSDQEPPAPDAGPFQWEDAADVLNDEGCKLEGNETVEGQPTKHYHCAETAVGAADTLLTDYTLKNAYRDYYISTELMTAIKSVIYWEGVSEDKPYSYKMESVVSSINEPITIEVPEGVAKPGPSDDMPIPENPEEMMSFGTMVSFRVAQAKEDVVLWYADEMPAAGWEFDAAASQTSDEMTSQVWKKDARTATLMISAEDEKTVVIIMTEGE